MQKPPPDITATRSKFHTEDLQICCDVVQNVVVTATWHTNLCTPGLIKGLHNLIQFMEYRNGLCWHRHMCCMSVTYTIREIIDKWIFRRQKSDWGNKMRNNCREIGFEDVRWMEVAQDRVWWQALVLTVLNLLVLLPES